MGDNIISINVPNGVSITIMALIGGIVVAFVRKAAMGRKAA